MGRKELLWIERTLRHAHVVDPAVEELSRAAILATDIQVVTGSDGQICVALRRHEPVVEVDANGLVRRVAHEREVVPFAVVEVGRRLAQGLPGMTCAQGAAEFGLAGIVGIARDEMRGDV